MRSLLGAAATALLVVLAACSQAPQKSAETPAAEAPAAAVETPAAEAPAAPAATMVELDVVDATGAKLSGDPVAGKKVFAQCATCHSAEKGVNRVGPSLYGIVGRHSGSIEGFRYSEANLKSGITWTEQEMFVYLENPKAKIPGTIMAFVGLKNPQQRANVIAYLQENAKQ